MPALHINGTIFGVSGKSCLVTAGILGTLALYILAWAYPTFPGDEWALVRLQAFRTDWLDSAALGFAKLGLFWVFVPASVFLIGYLLGGLSLMFLFPLYRRYLETGLGLGLTHPRLFSIVKRAVIKRAGPRKAAWHARSSDRM